MSHLVRAHWRHLANTIELLLPSAHPSLQLKRQIDRFSHSYAAHGRVLSGMLGHVISPNNCPIAWGSGPQLIHASLGLTRVHNSNGIAIGSRGVYPYLQMAQLSHYHFSGEGILKMEYLIWKIIFE